MTHIELMNHAKPELPAEQVNMLVKRAQRGDRNAEAKLVQHNLGLVAVSARQYRNAVVPVEDRMQAGTIGLIAAIRAFDPSKGNKLSTYATPKIRQAIRRLIHDTAHMIHVPVGQQDGRGAMTDAAASRLNVGSLNVTVETEAQGTGSTELLDLIGEDDAGFAGVDFRVALAGLSAQEADVLTARYLRDETLQEVADTMPQRDRHGNVKQGTTLSRERVRQIEAAALAKLREAQVA